MKTFFAAGGFALLIVLLLGCGALRAQESEPAGQESPAAAADNTGAGESAGETPQEKTPAGGEEDALTRFNEKTQDEQQSMINRAHEDMSKLTPEEQRQLAAAEKDYFSNMSPQQAAQEARDALSNMTPEQQDSVRAEWERQLQGNPNFTRLNAADRQRVLEQVRNFGKNAAPDIVTKDQGN